MFGKQAPGLTRIQLLGYVGGSLMHDTSDMRLQSQTRNHHVACSILQSAQAMEVLICGSLPDTTDGPQGAHALKEWSGMPVIVCSISDFFAFSAAFRSATSRPCSSRTCTPRVSTGANISSTHPISLFIGSLTESVTETSKWVRTVGNNRFLTHYVGRPRSGCTATMAYPCERTLNGGTPCACH